MTTIIIAIGVLSIIDLSATVEWITKDAYMEANPWMLQLWLYSPGLFVFSKILMTIIFCFVAYRYRRNKLLRHLIWLPLVAYMIVSGLHILALK